MFKTLLEKNYELDMRDDAKPFIMQDRTKYEDIITFILKFSSQNKLLISNIDLLLGKQDYWDAVDIYTLNVDEISKKLVSELCKNFDKVFLLKIFESDKEYYIEYNLRRICILNAIKPYKSFTIYDFISPIKYAVNNNKISIYLLPYLVEIIHLYSKLYDPSAAASWEDLYKDIKKTEVFVDKEIETLLKMKKPDLAVYISTTGGKECQKNKCKDVQDQKIIEIKKLVVEFLKNGHYILCNEFYDMDNPKIMEVISANVDVDFTMLVTFLSKFIEYGISYTKKTLYLPKENQMEKYNFYLEIPFVKNIKKKHFLTIYNNTSFELVNYYEKNGFKYADPITQLKFIYLSIWSSIIMQKTHGLHYEEFIEHIKLKKDQIMVLRGKIDLYELKKNYSGTYLPESLSKKLLLNFSGKKSSFYCFDF